MKRRRFLSSSIITALGLSSASVINAHHSSKSKKNTYTLSREIKSEKGYDLVIAGGGPAGSAAAIAAARKGARVLLLEATGCLGGMGTSGLVTAFDSMANGEISVVGGIMRELVEALYERGQLAPQAGPEGWLKRAHTWTAYNAEGYKIVLDDFTSEAGVEVRFYTKVIDADFDSEKKEVNGVITHNIDGYSYIEAKAYIDSTGDAVLSDICQVKCYEAGIDTPNIMPPTLCAMNSNIDWESMNIPKYRNSIPNQQKYLRQALDDGFFDHNNRHMPGISRTGDRVGFMNCGHLFNLNALRNKDLSGGMMEGRKLVQRYVEFFKKYVPGCENIEHVTTAALLGVRESRRIQGEYMLNVDDFMVRKKFPDQIGIFANAIDIHVYDDSDEQYERYRSEFHEWGRPKDGEYYGIPYGVLVPKGWKNLWVAGRCVSSDVQVQGAIRVQPACSMMGQAAGTAVVQFIETGQKANNLDTEQLVKTLRNDGAVLPQETLSRTMTRC